MSDKTPYQNLPLLMPGQALKYITYNEALQTLDLLLHCAIDETQLTALPANAPTGFRALISDNPEAVLAPNAQNLAAFDGTDWSFHTPKTGWRVYHAPSSTGYIYDGENWVQEMAETQTEFTGALSNLNSVGIGTSTSEAHVLSVRGASTLFSGEASHRIHLKMR